MKPKTNSKKSRRPLLPKLVSILTPLLFAIATTGYAQTDSCSAHASFTLTTTDHKNITITNYSSGNNLKYFWDFMDGTSSTDPNPGTHFYNNLAMHYVYLRVTDTIKNCSSSFLDTIPSTCSADFSWEYHYYDLDFTSHADASAAIFSWDFGDGTTSTLPSPSHHYINPGLYYACLTVSSTLDPSCSDKRCVTITVSDSTSDSTGICLAQYSYYWQHGFTYLFHAPQNNRNYLWDFGDGTTSALQNPEHAFSSRQLYKVCLTVSSKTSVPCKETYCNFVDVNLPVQCYAFYTIIADSSTTDPYDFLIYNQSSGNNLTYLWNFGDGTTSTLVNPTHDYAGTGPYVICLTVKNDSCSNTHCDTLDLSDTVHHLLPGKFHITVVDKTVTGIKKNDAAKTTLLNYPNPFSSTTTISYSVPTSSSVELEVYNLLGVKVATIEGGTKAPGNYTLEWNAQQLQEGIYLLQLKTNGQSITKKIIINK